MGVRECKRLVVHQPTSTHSAITHLYAIAPPSLFNPANLDSLAIHSCTSSVSTNNLMCHLCSAIVDWPIQLATCNRLVCMGYLCTSLREKGFCCPCCGSDHLHDFNTIVQPSPVVMKVLGDLPCGIRLKHCWIGMSGRNPTPLLYQMGN